MPAIFDFERNTEQIGHQLLATCLHPGTAMCKDCFVRSLFTAPVLIRHHFSGLLGFGRLPLQFSVRGENPKQSPEKHAVATMLGRYTVVALAQSSAQGWQNMLP
jgi:hypothetical protein